MWVALRSKHQCLYGTSPFGFHASSVPEAGEEVFGIRHVTIASTRRSTVTELSPVAQDAHGIDHASLRNSGQEPGQECKNGADNPPGAAVADKQGLSPFRVEPYSLAYYLRSTWISHALADPCLLHATLFSASAQLDSLTGARQSSYATLYHQFNAVRLVRSRLTMVALNSPDDATVASVLLLAIHGSLQIDRESTEVHRQGLLRIVATRGGLDKLGFNGFLAQLTQGSLSFLAITFDQPEPFPVPQCEAPLGPHNLICLVLDGSNKSPNEQLRHRLFNLFRDIQHLVREACTDSETLPSATTNPHMLSLLDRLWSEAAPALSGQPPAISKKELALLRACSISGRVLAYLLDDRVLWSEQQLDQFLEELEDAIDTTERATWLKHGPEANIWVAVMGAAMCKDINARASFILKENCVASAVRGTDWSRYVAARFCYRWLKDRRLARCASI
ncbi:hypothetical protein BDW71DRAFT_215555 [Aspergillus fruticulosus]